MSVKKVVVFGIDGCPEELLRKWVIDENKLPNFRRVYEEGHFNTMNTTIPFITVPGWAALLTGKNIGNLKEYSFFKRKNDSYNSEPVRLDWEKINPLWEILSKHGRRSIFINVPSTLAPKI